MEGYIMAKYIRRRMRSRIELMSEEQAAELVDNGLAEYVSKSEWKRIQEMRKAKGGKKCC
jgi:hypothetical protein